MVGAHLRDAQTMERVARSLLTRVHADGREFSQMGVAELYELVQAAALVEVSGFSVSCFHTLIC